MNILKQLNEQSHDQYLLDFLESLEDKALNTLNPIFLIELSNCVERIFHKYLRLDNFNTSETVFYSFASRALKLSNRLENLLPEDHISSTSHDEMNRYNLLLYGDTKTITDYSDIDEVLSICTEADLIILYKQLGKEYIRKLATELTDYFQERLYWYYEVGFDSNAEKSLEEILVQKSRLQALLVNYDDMPLTGMAKGSILVGASLEKSKVNLDFNDGSKIIFNPNQRPGLGIRWLPKRYKYTHFSKTNVKTKHWGYWASMKEFGPILNPVLFTVMVLEETVKSGIFEIFPSLGTSYYKYKTSPFRSFY